MIEKSIPVVVVSLPQVTNILTTSRPTSVVVGDSTPPYVPCFTLPLVTTDYPYSKPTAMMEILQSHASMFVGNATKIASPINPHLASGSAISNSGRMPQPQGGFKYVPPRMSALTINSLVSMRKQMDESNHEIMSMFIQHIGIVFHPLLIHNIT